MTIEVIHSDDSGLTVTCESGSRYRVTKTPPSGSWPSVQTSDDNLVVLDVVPGVETALLAILKHRLSGNDDQAIRGAFELLGGSLK